MRDDLGNDLVRSRTELERVAQRWQQLPLDRALSASAAVRQVVQQLADRVAAASTDPHQPQHAPGAPVPDLGPAVLMDQLRVMVYDWGQAGLPAADLADLLTSVRRSLP